MLRIGKLSLHTRLQQTTQPIALLWLRGKYRILRLRMDSSAWSGSWCDFRVMSISSFPGSDVLGLDPPFLPLLIVFVHRFLVQSALWDLAMASNVYLAFFRGYSIQSLRIMDLRYLILCYGSAAIPAFVFLFADRGEIYGATQPWCWINKPWDYLRLGLCYAPVW